MNADKIEIATELSGRITRNKHNHDKLIELTEEARIKLGIELD